jgi:hypothetical protein
LSNLTKSSYGWLQFATQTHRVFLLVNFRLISTWKILFQCIQRIFFHLKKWKKKFQFFQRKNNYDKFQYVAKNTEGFFFFPAFISNI